jgi:hypothetical protein
MKSFHYLIITAAFASLGACKKQSEVKAPLTPAPTQTPHVYKLGEPRPIVLNDLNAPVDPNDPNYLRRAEEARRRITTPAPEAGDAEHKQNIARLQSEADRSKQDQQNKEASQRNRWNNEHQDAAWRARYGTERPPPDPKTGFRPTIAPGK